MICYAPGKKLVIFLLLLLMISACNNGGSSKKQKPKAEDPDHPSLKGKVKSYTEISYLAEPDEDSLVKKGAKSGLETLLAEERASFDTSGNETEHKTYSVDGELFQTRIYVYNEHKKLIETSAYDKDKKLVWKITYSLDKKDRIKKYSHTYDVSDQSPYTTFEYDKQGNMILNKNYNEYDKLLSAINFEYNTQGNKTGGTVHNSKNEKESSFSYTYDVHENMLSETEYDSRGILSRKYEYSYNAANLRTKKIWYVGERKYREWEYTYDEKNNLIQSVLSEYIEDKPYELEKKVYINDPTGNWIQQVIYRQHKAMWVIERVLEYYQ